MGDISLLKHPLILLFTGFVLTGVIGKFLSGKIQRKNWEYQFKIKRWDRQVKEARTTYEHISLY